MSFNGSGTFNINSAGQPVVTGTVISSTDFNALTQDLATGLSTCITKDGQTTTTQRIPFALGASFATTTYANGTANIICGTTTNFNNMDTNGGQIGATRGFYCSDNAGLDWGAATYVKGFNNSHVDVLCHANGVTLLADASAWSALSDERHKTKLVPFSNALDKISRISAGTGRYLKDEQNVNRSFLTAQSVQKVLPEAVSDLDGVLQLRYTDVIPLLVAALGEIKGRLEVLEAR